MSDFMQKARQGRIAALNKLGANGSQNVIGGDFGQRNRSGNHHEKVVFLSSRVKSGSVMYLN